MAQMAGCGVDGAFSAESAPHHDIGALLRKPSKHMPSINEDPRTNNVDPGIRRTAAAYSPTWWGSTIGDGGLNFSVRNGKRWYPAAIATAVYYLREITHSATKPEYAFFVYFAFPYSAIFLLRKDFGLLVQVD